MIVIFFQSRSVFGNNLSDEWIVYDTHQIESNSNIWMVKSDNSEKIQITQGSASDKNPVVSHDGKWILFSRVMSGDSISNIYKMRINGSDIQQLTFFDALSAGSGSWSYDNTKIVFTTVLPNSQDTDIYMVNADGSNSTPVLTDGYKTGTPFFRPIDSRIYFISDRGGIDYELFSMNQDGTDIQKVLSTQFRVDGGTPGWNQGGNKLAILKRPYPNTPYIIDFSDTSMTQLASVEDVDIVDWSPDGNKLVFESGNDNAVTNLYLINPDGTDLQQLSGFHGHRPSWEYVTQSEIGLDAYYPFSGDANDESGKGNDAVVYDGSLAEDRFGNLDEVYSFDGANDWIDPPDSIITYDTGFSISLWAEPLSSSGGVLLGRHYQTSGFDDRWSLRLSDSVYFNIGEFSSGATNLNLLSVGYQPDQWNHLVFYYNTSGEIGMYVNGVLVDSTTLSDTQNTKFVNSTYNFVFGRDFENGSYYNGLLDDIRFYNRELSPGEINLFFGENDGVPPLAPQSLTADSMDDQIILSWSPNEEKDFSMYRLYRGASSPAITLIDSITGTSSDTIYNDTTVTNGLRYFYRITAVDSVGNESSFSNEVSATLLPLMDGLILYYPFDGKSNDVSGNGYQGTIQGSPTYTKGVTNQAIHLQGAGFTSTDGDHVLLPVIPFPSEFTISLWVNEESMSDPDGEAYIFFGDARDGWLGIGHFNDYVAFAVGDKTENTSAKAISVPFNYNDRNKYVLYTLTYNNGVSKAFRNGIKVGELTQLINVANSNAAIGRHWWYSNTLTSTRLTGSIDDVRIYDYELASSDILNLYEEVTNDNPPDTPKILTVDSTDAWIKLTWARSNESDINKYRVYRDTTPPAVTLLDSITGFPLDTLYSDNTVTNGQRYFYRITAVDSTGNESAFSNEVSATTYAPNSGLLAYYPLNGDAKDASGNSNDGLVQGALPSKDRFGNPNSSYSFDGINDYIEINSAAISNLSFPCTITLWYKSGQIDSDVLFQTNNYLFDQKYSGMELFISGADSTLRFRYGDNTGNYDTNRSIFISSPGTIRDTSWTFIAVTAKDENTCKLYINDYAEIPKRIGTASLASDGSNARIGGPAKYGSMLSGSIDDIRIYNRAVSDLEIESFYQPVKPPSNLVATANIDSIQLRWSYLDNSDISKYYIYRNTSSGASALIDSLIGTPPDQQYTDIDVIRGQEYFYRIIAVDTSGVESGFSEEVSAVPDDYKSPVVTLLSPTGNEQWPEGSRQVIRWHASDNDSVHHHILSYSTDGGTTFSRIDSLAGANDSLRWTLPDTVTEQAYVKVFTVDATGNVSSDTNDVAFFILDNTSPTIKLMPGIAGLTYGIGDTLHITWSASDNVGIKRIDIYLSTDGGNNWFATNTNLGNSGSTDWIIGNYPSDQCRLMGLATDSSGFTAIDTTQGFFTIRKTYPHVVSNPLFVAPLDTIHVRFSQPMDTAGIDRNLLLYSEKFGKLNATIGFDSIGREIRLSPIESFTSRDTLTLLFLADSTTSRYGYGLDGNENTSFEGSPSDNDTLKMFVRYAGDFNGDDQVNFDDLSFLSKGWYSKNYQYELGPVTGQPPYVTIRPDQQFDIHDAMTFGRMWNWFVGLGKYRITAPTTTSNAQIRSEQNGNHLVLFPERAVGTRIVLSYDPTSLQIERTMLEAQQKRGFEKSQQSVLSLFANQPDSGRLEYINYHLGEKPQTDSLILKVTADGRSTLPIQVGMEGINDAGKRTYVILGVIQYTPVPEDYILYQNYPNPFREETTIEYGLPYPSAVKLRIFNLLGEEVMMLVNEEQPAKYYTIYWDGTNSLGRLVSNGLYFVQLQAQSDQGSYTSSKKILFVK